MKLLTSALAGLTAAIIWLISASALYCYLASRMPLFRFPYFQWLDALPYWRANWHMTLYVIVSALIPSMVFVTGFVMTIRTSKRQVQRPGVSGNHGNASFAPAEAIHRRFNAQGGCLIGALGRSPDAFQLYDDPNKGPGHSLVIAGPGSDKTNASVNRIWNWHGPRVVFDPSLQIGPIMVKALRQRGHNVIIIGPAAGGLNVLDWIDPKDPEADAYITTAVDWIYDEGAATKPNQSKDPQWTIWGKSLVKTLLADLLYSNEPDTPRTLEKLMVGMNFPENKMPHLLQGIYDRSASKMARGGASGLMGMRADETFSGIFANARGATDWLNVGTYARMTSGTTMRTNAILDSNTVVFIQIPLYTLQSTPTLGRAVMGALFNAMYRAEGSVGERILFLLDEAWSLGAMKEIELCFATARKYRGTIQMIFPSEAKMEMIWTPTGAQFLRDECSWRSYNAIQDGRIAERLSKDLGGYTELTYSSGVNTGSQKPWGIAFPSSSRSNNTNTHEMRHDLLRGDEILRLPADEMIVMPRDFPWAIRCNTAPFYRYPEIARRMDVDRFEKAAAE